MILSTHKSHRMQQLINGEQQQQQKLKVFENSVELPLTSVTSYYYCIDLTAGEHKFIKFMNDK